MLEYALLLKAVPQSFTARHKCGPIHRRNSGSGIPLITDGAKQPELEQKLHFIIFLTFCHEYFIS